MQIYCNKCKKFTNTKSEKFTTTEKGRTRVSGICKDCGINKGMFVNKDRTFNKKVGEELEMARYNRKVSTINKMALAIGKKILNSDEETKKCITECLPELLKGAKKKKEKND